MKAGKNSRCFKSQKNRHQAVIIFLNWKNFYLGSGVFAFIVRAGFLQHLGNLL